ncbi:hypothetical protein OQJ02_00295 [Legionella sp. PATHC032]|uniref:hypothetical protein n=1 Tax=Legionella sp. PATHC032 TaxID=2992039 RepID=UPI001B2DAAFB|nr:hypothetical protein [Legionella sp. PATHC032]MCW8420076.1 hypothetical protein [Legionella sp. PATHC032]HAZ7574475.1 hypothetical protein [Legionella pneumophila]HBA1635391.1 hypothetical protein [Legionella pneumophila]
MWFGSQGLINPVKHKYAATTKEWLYSSFSHYVQSGLLDENWGGVAVIGEFGEKIGDKGISGSRA